MKKIIVFTASTGEGHNQVARTLKDELLQKGYDVKIIDFVKKNKKIMEILIENGYKIMTSMLPKIYGLIYKITNKKYISYNLKKIISLEEFKIGKDIISNFPPDLIIGTHPFSVGLTSALKRRRNVKCPFITIVTDFDAHHTYICNQVNAYITGSHYTNMTLINKGISSNRVHAFGIPIAKSFYNESLKKEKKEKLFSILFMSGSMGLKPMKSAIFETLKAKNSFNITIVCGNNLNLYKELNNYFMNYTGDKIVKIIGYTDKVSTFMNESDIIITKPGGITVTEAIIMKTPLIIPYFIPGHEEDNKDFLILSKAAINVDNIKKLPNIIDNLIISPWILKDMKNNMLKLSKTYSMDNIINLIEEMLKVKNN